jgi:hypothetical protein
MRWLQRRTSTLLMALGLASSLLVLTPAGASAQVGGSATCHGGSVASGVYSSLDIAGLCALNAGPVVVQQNLTLEKGSGLNAAFGGSDLAVGGNVVVMQDAILVLGCEPQAFPCFNDNPTHPTMSTHDSVGGNLTATSALMMLIHNNVIGGAATQTGGGGGVTCSFFPLGQNGPPAYSTYEDNTIGNGASITGVNTCWLGFIRNRVWGTVNYNNNITADEDGNEVVTNLISGKLNCAGNSPDPQFGDSGGDPNLVAGGATGQCTSLV